MRTDDRPLPIFVYGTLQRGEERAPLWPRSPRRIRAAWIRGALYDLGPYPALVPGTCWVRGELWEIAAEDLPVTLRTLDAIEGFSGRADDWYVRQVVECFLERVGSGEVVEAYTYFFNRPERLREEQRVAVRGGECAWHRGERVTGEGGEGSTR